MLRVDQVHVVRHKVLVEGRSIRAVAREMGISRNTVDRYLGELTAPRRLQKAPRRRTVWERAHVRIEHILKRSVALDGRQAATLRAR
jgi:transposase